MNVALETFPAGLDTAPIFKGLPDDRCQCPHWGYVLKGRMRIRYPDREEVIEAGDAYYLEPGHLPLIEEDTEVLEFSPKGERRTTLRSPSALRPAYRPSLAMLSSVTRPSR
jgi:hypothetical protein